MLRQYYLDHSPEFSPAALLDQPGVLSVVLFNNRCIESEAPGIIMVGAPSLIGRSIEVIEYSNEVATRGITGQCHWSCIDDVICAAIWITPEQCKNMMLATEIAYNALFSVVQDAGFRYPFRVWNFIPGINQGAGDDEAYKKFCVGRQRAFDSLEVSHQRYPAASAVGNGCAGAVIYMLASKAPVQHYENPRQEPAYRYPREYGPSSPSFSRASGVRMGSKQQIFISGTASILGHDTKACGNLEEQLALTVSNIQYLLQNIDKNTAPLEAVRVYLRNKADLASSQSYLSAHFPMLTMNFIHADICRENLLVEIEAQTYSITDND